MENEIEEQSSQNSYKQIVKNTALFGGVQIIQILSTVLRGKFVALFLGTTGIGINALLSSAISVIVQFASLGINFSAVRDISQAKAEQNSGNLAHIIVVFKRWIYFCAFFGAVTICIFSKQLSILSFGNTSFKLTFIISSLVVVFNILNSANITILQGRHQLNEIAKASLWSAAIGLIGCIPCYYFFRLEGILPAIICSSVISFIISSFFVKKIKTLVGRITIRETIVKGTNMAKLGVALMTATLMGTAVTYLINTYIGSHGTISDVGLYSAGISITNQYIGFVFTAMAAGYFPKLSSICTDRLKVNEIVNSQSEIVILVSAPILIIMMLTAPFIIRLLLSSQFLIITNFVYWAAFAMFFKAASFAAGYISFAKGDKKTFFIFEGILANLLILFSNVIGYKIGGLTGIAQGILISYVIYLVSINLLVAHLYKFELKKDFIFIFGKLAFLLGSVLFFVLKFQNNYKYLFGSVLFLITIIYSFIELNKRLAIRDIIASKLKIR